MNIHTMLLLESIFLQIPTDLINAFIQSAPLWLMIIIVSIVIFLVAGKYVETWIGIFKKGKASVTESRAEKKTTSNIRQRLDESRKELRDQFKLEVLSFDFEIQWHGKSTRPHINNEDKVVIVLDDETKNFSENFALAVYQYSSQAILPIARKYLTPGIITSIDLAMTKKILNTKKQDALDFFENGIYSDEIKKQDSIPDYFKTLINLDYYGIFTRVFLKELDDFGKRMHPTLSNSFIRDDSEQFMQYFKEIASKSRGADIKTDSVKGEYIQVGVVYIAGQYLKSNNRTSYEKPETTPYVRHIHSLIAKDITSIYLLAIGEDFVKFTDHLLKYFETQEKVAHIDSQKFEVATNVDGIVGLIRLKSPSR